MLRPLCAVGGKWKQKKKQNECGTTRLQKKKQEGRPVGRSCFSDGEGRGRGAVWGGSGGGEALVLAVDTYKGQRAMKSVKQVRLGNENWVAVQWIEHKRVFAFSLWLF